MTNKWNLNVTPDGQYYLYLEDKGGILLEITQEQLEKIKNNIKDIEIEKLPF